MARKLKNRRQGNLVVNTEVAEKPPSTLQRITINLKPVTRRERMEGREYMVCPMVMLTEGVHAGSNGPLFYPGEELSKTPAVWNHKPIVINHPTINGQAISACEPAVITSRKVGLIMNTKWEAGKNNQPGRLKAEAWFEINRLKEVDARVLDVVNAKGKKLMEVSTGLFTDNDLEEGEWNGERYEYIARNYRPDHLAVLPDEKGACSIEDGAGLMRNSQLSFDDRRMAVQKLLPVVKGQSGLVCDSSWICDMYDGFCVYQNGKKMFKQSYRVDNAGSIALDGLPQEVYRTTSYKSLDGKVINMQGDAMTKKQLVDAIITNSVAGAATGWVEEDRDVLMGMDDNVLVKIAGPVANESDEEIERPAPRRRAAPVANARKNDGDEDEDDEDDESPANNTASTVEQYIAAAPPEMRDVLVQMSRSHKAQKDKLIKVITANKANKFTPGVLMNKSVEELEAIAALARGAESVKPAGPALNFTGMGDVESGSDDMTTNTADEEAEEGLEAPTYNFAKAEK